MRIVRVWIFATFLIFTVSIGWWISQPVVFGIARGLNSTITNQNGRNAMLAVEYGSIAWGPVMIIFILLWAIISSSKRDVESVVYG